MSGERDATQCHAKNPETVPLQRDETAPIAIKELIVPGLGDDASVAQKRESDPGKVVSSNMAAVVTNKPIAVGRGVARSYASAAGGDASSRRSNSQVSSSSSLTLRYCHTTLV